MMMYILLYYVIPAHHHTVNIELTHALSAQWWHTFFHVRIDNTCRNKILAYDHAFVTGAFLAGPLPLVAASCYRIYERPTGHMYGA